MPNPVLVCPDIGCDKNFPENQITCPLRHNLTFLARLDLTQAFI